MSFVVNSPGTHLCCRHKWNRPLTTKDREYHGSRAKAFARAPNTTKDTKSTKESKDKPLNAPHNLGDNPGQVRSGSHSHSQFPHLTAHPVPFFVSFVVNSPGTHLCCRHKWNRPLTTKHRKHHGSRTKDFAKARNSLTTKDTKSTKESKDKALDSILELRDIEVD